MYTYVRVAKLNTKAKLNVCTYCTTYVCITYVNTYVCTYVAK